MFVNKKNQPKLLRHGLTFLLFRNRFVNGFRLRRTYVAPAPPSHSLALVKAMTHLCHGLVVSHRKTLDFKIGLTGDDRPRP